MFSQLSSVVTEGIRVSVRSRYLEQESSPKHMYFFFAYKVTIVNESPYRVKLMSRKWHITDGYGGKRVVEGDGVIGQQPVLEPGESHEYVSGCDFNSPMGQMSGFYTMVREIDDQEFKVKIPKFLMTVPWLLN